MIASPWFAALFALFAWWFSTGAILWVVKTADERGRDGHIWSVLYGLPVLGLGVAGFVGTLESTDVAAAYIAFLAALAIWGWIELAFLSGVITGPNTYHCPIGVSQWERFLRSWGTIAYHELLLLGVLALLLMLSIGAEDTVGFWTFAVLFFARVSAKLNAEFFPGVLDHLPSHFRYAKLNPVFPFSITALSFAVACWLERLYTAASPIDAVMFALLATLTALALLEHWLMVLRLPDEKLWRWMIPAPKTQDKNRLREDANGL